MLKKLTKLLTNNFSLKVAALLFAIAMWLVVVSIDDPTQTRPFTTAISIENADYMQSQGRYFEPLDTDMMVTFKVSVPRSVMKNLSNTDFKAVADMESIEEVNKAEGLYRVPIDIVATRYASSIAFSGKTQYMEVKVEDLVTAQFPLKASYVGEPGENSAVGNMKVSPNIIKVTGPESVIDEIGSVQAVIDVTGATTDLTDSVTPTVYNAAGEVMDVSKLNFSIDKATVTAEILNIRKLNIRAETSGIAANGYICTEVKIEPNRIAVKGNADILQTLGDIVIPSAVLNITGANVDVVQTVDITEYLPEGVSLVNEGDAEVTLTAVVEEIVTREYELPADSITIEGNVTGRKVSIGQDTVKVSIRGVKSHLDTLDAATLGGRIEVGGLTEGTHLVPLHVLYLNEDIYTVIGSPTVEIEITGAASGDGNNSPDNGGSTGGGNTDNGNVETE